MAQEECDKLRGQVEKLRAQVAAQGGVPRSAPARAATEKATFAGGCFWCMEPPYDAIPGVISTTSGYTSGHTVDPTYKEVSAGKTGHTEAVKIVTGIGTTLSGRLLLFDALGMKFRELKLRPNPERPVIDGLIDYQEFCGVGGSAPGQEEAGSVPTITVAELKTVIDGQLEEFLLLDVRNPQEAEIAVIPGSVLVPLDRIESGEAIDDVRRLAEGKQLYVHCKLGGRSAKALLALGRHGIEGVNVAGGIQAWSEEIDPSVPRY
jgi:rhodanese-related sulfurtransferase